MEAFQELNPASEPIEGSSLRRERLAFKVSYLGRRLFTFLFFIAFLVGLSATECECDQLAGFFFFCMYV